MGRSTCGHGAGAPGSRDRPALYFGGQGGAWVRDTDPYLTALDHSYDAVVFGSPGMGVDDRSRLDVFGEVYRVEARWDGVADFGGFGADPSSTDDVTGLGSGAVVLDGQDFSQSTFHSDYLTDESTSLHNLAAVMVGNTDRLIVAP
ncbi:hypothetical protein [Sanguibacter sp. 25GB23B1]|uniref:hypothetical protein n=1 Tax=unclassified Sanguibacter TaxID=2645534 RepID=UPI0032AF8ECA